MRAEFALDHVLLAKVLYGAAPPGANEVVVEDGSDGRAGDGDGAGEHLLGHFGADLRGDAADDGLHEFGDHRFFKEFATDVHSGSAGGCDPEFGNLFVSVVLKSVNQT